MPKEIERNAVAPHDLMERALQSPKGIRVFFPRLESAVSMRNRMTSLCVRERKKSTRTYPLDHPLYNTSPYDSLAIVIKPGTMSTQEEVTTLLQQKQFPAVLDGVWLYLLPEGMADLGFIVEELD